MKLIREHQDKKVYKIYVKTQFTKPFYYIS